MRKRNLTWSVAMVVALLGVGLTAPAGSSATTAAEWGPGFKACGAFKDHSQTIHVFAKDISCEEARRIQKELWLGPRRRQVVHIPKLGPAEIRLKRFPGYVCRSGTGGGTCIKGEKVAAYSNLP